MYLSAGISLLKVTKGRTIPKPVSDVAPPEVAKILQNPDKSFIQDLINKYYAFIKEFAFKKFGNNLDLLLRLLFLKMQQPIILLLGKFLF